MRTFAVILLAAALALGQQAQPAPQTAHSLLENAATDKNPDVRKQAAEALSLVGTGDNLFHYLGLMLNDHDVSVRVAAVISLGDFKSRKTIPSLEKALDDPVPEVSFAAAKVLYSLHDPAGKQFLLAVVSGESKGSSSYLTTKARNALRLLHTPTTLFTTAAIGAAMMVAPVPGLGVGLASVQGILSDPDSSAQAAALLLLGNPRDRDPAVADAVRSALTDKEWSVRAAAVHVTAMHPYPQFRAELIPLMDDKKAAVRLRAAAAYIRLDRRTVTPHPKRAKTRRRHTR